jgi:hypothetical protein
MQMTLFTLVGFALTTICTSICPMNMGMMSMNMNGDDMQMAAHTTMDMGEQKEMPCKRFEQEEEEIIALSSSSNTIQVVSHVPFAVFSVVVSYKDALHKKQSQLLLANGPPIPTETLVGTVILRT